MSWLFLRWVVLVCITVCGSATIAIVDFVVWEITGDHISTARPTPAPAQGEE